ncbi:hypothetical protein EJP82_16870 [Paenibacillus anaericanus]|uniref:Uncharacterized protein n=1 Tax=Paenibacillus anaericanus TaxID=170367 RepID=A0A433Y6I8_9BACL|nr:hypothetical protein [Paenibacillus anaericanus]RUT44634.1 hypothetical protein EJP82_16870 [Paenibacillus anaericanus]
MIKSVTLLILGYDLIHFGWNHYSIVIITNRASSVLPFVSSKNVSVNGGYTKLATGNDNIQIREERLMMEPAYKDRSVEVEHREVQKKSDSSVVASTFIKYAAYIIIFFGALYFLVKYVFPLF